MGMVSFILLAALHVLGLSWCFLVQCAIRPWRHRAPHPRSIEAPPLNVTATVPRFIILLPFFMGRYLVPFEIFFFDGMAGVTSIH